MPQPNTFITTDFSLVKEDSVHPQCPEKIVDSEKINLWYRKDQLFKLPNAYYFYYLITPLVSRDCERLILYICLGMLFYLFKFCSNCLLDLFVNLLNLHLAEEAYPAVLADLSYEIAARDRGLVIKVEGFNQNLPVSKYTYRELRIRCTICIFCRNFLNW